MFLWTCKNNFWLHFNPRRLDYDCLRIWFYIIRLGYVKEISKFLFIFFLLLKALLFLLQIILTSPVDKKYVFVKDSQTFSLTYEIFFSFWKSPFWVAFLVKTWRNPLSNQIYFLWKILTFLPISMKVFKIININLSYYQKWFAKSLPKRCVKNIKKWCFCGTILHSKMAGSS